MAIQQITKEQFEIDFKGLKTIYGSYENYQQAQLMQLKKESVMTYAKNTSDYISNSVKGWALEKEQKKNESKSEYEAALAQYDAVKYQKEKTYSLLKSLYNNYGEDSTQYGDKYKLFTQLNKQTSSAETNWKIAMDHFNSDNMSAFKAFLTSRQV